MQLVYQFSIDLWPYVQILVFDWIVEGFFSVAEKTLGGFPFVVVAVIAMIAGCGLFAVIRLVLEARHTLLHTSRPTLADLKKVLFFSCGGLVATCLVLQFLGLYVIDYSYYSYYPLVGFIVMAFVICVAVLTLIGLGTIAAVSIEFILKLLVQGKKRELQLVQTLLLVISLIPFIFAAVFLIGFFQDPNWGPNGNKYFVLNAAIKNTCFVDPNGEHCPQKLEDIGVIEPKHFAAAQREAQLIYRYYPDTGIYTLIVRYTPSRAIIFDPRFIPEHGNDLKEVRVTTLGRDRLSERPAFDGPWDEIQEWDKW